MNHCYLRLKLQLLLTMINRSIPADPSEKRTRMISDIYTYIYTYIYIYIYIYAMTIKIFTSHKKKFEKIEIGKK